MTESLRAEFCAGLDFELDEFQAEALDAVDAGHNVLVTAPTGAGKTVVAEYALARARSGGGRSFYTTPLKALSNQKLADLAQRFGTSAVGLLTGDNSIRPRAPIVVMTTEVLRNMIYEGSSTLDDLATVVLDEVHYLQDRSRGAVWEEVIVHLPERVRLVCLSATVSNHAEIGDWIAAVRGDADVVVAHERPVELIHRYALEDRASDDLVVLDTFVERDGRTVPNPQGPRYDRQHARRGARRGRQRIRSPWRVDIADYLAAGDLLPAIFFVFSRDGCDAAVRQLYEGGLRLTARADVAAIDEIAQRHCRSLSDEDRAALGFAEWLDGLHAGIAAHHAGIVPPMKETVEEAFSAGLVKIVVATETLALGVNMPARTVVIERLTKFSGERHTTLTAGEFTQLTGRAGRRGLDDVGYAVVAWSPFTSFEEVARLAAQRSYPLRSSFRPDYNMVVNLVATHAEPEARRLLELSLAQFHADRDVVGLRRRLERESASLERLRARAADGPGDIAELRRLTAEADAARAAARAAQSPDAFRPGDVLSTSGFGAVVVLRPGAPNGRLSATDRAARALKLGRRDLEDAQIVGHATLPTPIRPGQAGYRESAAEHLVSALQRTSAASLAGGPPSPALERAVAALEQHPANRDPRRGERVAAAAEADRLARRVDKLTRRLGGREGSITATFDRVHELLSAWGYVHGWELSAPGRMLARVYAENDLLAVEALREGHFDDLAPPELAALVSALTYQARGPDADEPLEPSRWPSKQLRRRVRELESIAADLEAAELDQRLPVTARVDPGILAGVHAWASGEALAGILEAEELSGGDFVRNIKQVIDLTRQIGAVAPRQDTATTAQVAADACLRGVVAASTLLR